MSYDKIRDKIQEMIQEISYKTYIVTYRVSNKDWEKVAGFFDTKTWSNCHFLHIN